MPVQPPVQPILRTPSAYDYPLLLKQLWITPLANAPEQEIVYRGALRFTYRQTYERIRRLTGALRNLGVEAGQTVAVMDWDSHRYLECFFAVPMIGCVLQTVNIRLSPEQIAYTLNHAQADLILVNAEFLPLVAGIRAKLEKDVQFVLLRDPDATAPLADLPFLGEYEALLEMATPVESFPDFDENARATTFYTTGTTGLPKGVYFSHRQLVLHTLAILAHFGTAPGHGRVHREDVYMPITPMFHVHGWGMPYAATLMGIKQIYPGRYDPQLLLNLIEREHVTLSHCVPTLLHMLISHPQAKQTDLSRLKMVIGGSALPQGLCRAALKHGIDVYTGYGMSETGPLQVVNHLTGEELHTDLDAQAQLRVRTGKPVMLCHVRVVDERMHDVPHDGRSQGEVVFRSPWLTQGYLNDAEKAEELWRGGWLHSGDIGSIDAEGRLQIRDRVKDVIKTGGEWISSLTLEDLISQDAAVAEVAVIGVPDEKWGERPLALVVPQPGTEPDAEAIRRRLLDAAERGAISSYGVPERIEFVDSLAKTSVGKLDKKALRQHYRAN
ncbi:MAG: fatty acid--CoA ligase [Gammaproteobacteria bacterium]|nr:fatty acid--CoA ligase [Gammaproteobacteria bacterium]